MEVLCGVLGGRLFEFLHKDNSTVECTAVNSARHPLHYYSEVTFDICKTSIGVHDIHGRMYNLATILLAHEIPFNHQPPTL